MNLTGYKTYIVGIGSIAWAGIGLYLGHLDAASAEKIIETALLGMTIRHAISTTGAKT